jgi:hypothetical protein
LILFFACFSLATGRGMSSPYTSIGEPATSNGLESGRRVVGSRNCGVLSARKGIVLPLALLLNMYVARRTGFRREGRGICLLQTLLAFMCSIILGFSASPDDGYYLLNVSRSQGQASIQLRYYFYSAVQCVNAPQTTQTCTEYDGPTKILGDLYTTEFAETTRAALGLFASALSVAVLMCLGLSCVVCTGDRNRSVASLAGALDDGVSCPSDLSGRSQALPDPRIGPPFNFSPPPRLCSPSILSPGCRGWASPGHCSCSSGRRVCSPRLGLCRLRAVLRGSW